AIHHDYDKMPNGNIIAILWSKHKRPDEVEGGIPNTEYEGGVILSETIAEIEPSGKIVWKWVAEDHLKAEEYPVCPLDYRKRWLHANSIQFLSSDNPIFTGKELILVSLRQPSASIIIDKGSGNILWRYGGYLEGEWARLGHQHSFDMIGAKIGGKELPGYGNLLVFDNGMHNAAIEDWGLPRSKVVEIDPKTKKVVWAFTHHEEKFAGWMPPEFKFNSPYIAGAQRLPNGNTLICEGASGRIFEVTKGGEIVWEFINPERRALFRTYRYGPDFAGFMGKGLPKPD
ncbi:MAG: aryl-sulfate sulfotransferase, partial [Deltaproteobacteria bacterium]|nr:aryl-sulfate sulfotransferase [Deltaproteobacteria bacterium]